MHLITLFPHLTPGQVRPDNTFEISIDHTLVNHGSLLDSFTPPVNPPAEIDDPADSMPKDWDERSAGICLKLI